VDIDITHFSTVELTEFRTGHCLGVRPVLLSVGRLTARKGLLEFVRHSMPLIVQRFPDALLVVIGDTPSDALHAIPQSKDSILRGALEVGVGENIRFLGRVDDRELACAYQTSQVHVFPVIQIPGDPEGFGMVAIEAAACALPTVAFACGGVIDAVSDGRSGFLVHPGDYLELATRICDILSSKVDLSLSSVEFARRFDWTHFNAGIRAVLERLDDS
jgi:phosphatidylinositol alpha-1,6-mannosyltransferase